MVLKGNLLLFCPLVDTNNCWENELNRDYLTMYFQSCFAIAGIEWGESNFESISQTSRCGFGQDFISSGRIAIFAFCSQWRSASNEAAYETGKMINEWDNEWKHSGWKLPKTSHFKMYQFSPEIRQNCVNFKHCAIRKLLFCFDDKLDYFRLKI